MIVMNCKEVESAISVSVCVPAQMYVYTQTCVSDINEYIQKMDLNRWGRETAEELVGLSKACTNSRDKQRHSPTPPPKKQQLSG